MSRLARTMVALLVASLPSTGSIVVATAVAALVNTALFFL